jgi:sulfide:quinone oxidoreductase
VKRTINNRNRIESYHLSKSLNILVVGGSFAGLKTAWDLRKKISRRHKITLISDKAKTTIRASFPRVVYENVPLESLTFDLERNLSGTGITFVEDRLLGVDQANDQVRTTKGKKKFDYLVIATGARHAYELIPGSRKYAMSICDPSRILETRDSVLAFRGGDVYVGVSSGFTPCDGPPMEMLMGLDHHLREIGARGKARLHFMTDKSNLLPPGGPETWAYLDNLFKKHQIITHLEVELKELDSKYLYFKDGSKKPYDLCLLVPPYRGVKELEGSGLTDERGFIPVEKTMMRAQNSEHYNIYAVGDAAAIPGPKQGHISLLQAGVAASHLAWRINKGGVVPSYLPEFKCVVYLGGGNGLYIYSDWLSDGDVVKLKEGHQPYLSKIKFEKLFFARHGDIGELHKTMMK